MSILSRLNRIEKIITESSVNDIKDIYNPEYDRQRAEDLLYNTIGPMTDNPTFSPRWNALTPMPEGFVPSGPSPKWNSNEISFAMAGDPSMIDSRSYGNPKHPAYGNRGGSPIYRMASRLSRKYRKPDLLVDLYSLGLLALSKKMQPGQDQSRGAFISWVSRTIESEMEFGVGTTLSVQDLLGYEATKYVDKDGNVKVTAPKKEPERTEFLRTHKIQKLYGLQWVKEQTDPKAIRQAASVVKGPYQNESSNDKNVGNPFAPYSAEYYRVVMQYADALASKNEEQIDAALKDIEQLIDRASDSSVVSAGAATGLGQAITQKDRAASSKSHIIELISNNPDNLKQAEQVILKHKGNVIDKDSSSITFSLAIPFMAMERAVKEISKFGKAKLLRSERNMSVVSADATADDEKGSIGSSLADTRDEGDKGENAEVIHYILEKCLTNDPAKLISGVPKYRNKIVEILRSINSLGGIDKELNIDDVRGIITAAEYRYLLRGIAPFLAGKYPGMGKPRSKTNIPRDKTGWWSPGEDPEIEPLDYVKKANPEAELEDTWTSIWVREGMPRYGTTEIATEMTKEVMEFQQLGIPTARQSKGDKPVVSKQSVNIGYQSALAKFKMMRAIFQDELGLSESRSDRKVFVEEIDVVDKEMIEEAFNTIILSLHKVLVEDIKKTVIT